MSKICPKCHKKNNDTAKYCINCGEQLDEEITEIIIEAQDNVTVTISDNIPIKNQKMTSDEPSEEIQAKIRKQLNTKQPKTNKEKLKKIKVVASPNNQRPKNSSMKYLVFLVILGVIGLIGYRVLFAEPDEPHDYSDLVDQNVTTDTLDLADRVQLSGTKAFSIDPVNGINISANANALDQERDFDVYLVSDEALYDIAKDYPNENSFVFEAFELDAGLADNEVFPGDVKLTIDMAELNIPSGMWEGMKLVRLASDGSYKTLATYVNGSQVIAYTNQNSIIVLIGSVFIPIGGTYLASTDLADKYLFNNGYATVKFENYLGFEGYNLRWPETMEAANPAEIDRVYQKLDQICNKYQTTIAYIQTTPMWQETSVKRETYRSNIINMYGQLFNDPDFKELQELALSIGWIKENVFPTQVKYVYEALFEVDDYLFYYRDFDKPNYVVQIAVLDKWNYPGQNVMGISDNPLLATPYVHINGLELPKSSDDSTEFKNKMNDLKLTMAHEIFHISQTEYVGVSWNNYIWFFEATAALLETEAGEYFVGSSYETPVNYTKYENFMFTMAKSSFFTEAEMQNHGYASHAFLKFLRDGYFEDNKSAFLPMLMNCFRNEVNNNFEDDFTIITLKSITDASSTNYASFREDIRDFYLSISGEIFANVKSTYEAQIDPYYSLIKEQFTTITSKSPIFMIPMRYIPYSTQVSLVKIEYDLEQYKNDSPVLLVKTDALASFAENMIIQVTTNGTTFEQLNENGLYVNNDVKVTNVKYNYRWIGIEEIHDYIPYGLDESGRDQYGVDDDSDVGTGSYTIAVMYRPSMVTLSKGSNNELIIDMPQKESLFAANLVKGWLVEITVPGYDLPLVFECYDNQLSVQVLYGSYLLSLSENKTKIENAASNLALSNLAIKYDYDWDAMYEAISKTVKAGNTFTVTAREIANTATPVYGPKSNPVSIVFEEQQETKTMTLTSVPYAPGSGVDYYNGLALLNCLINMSDITINNDGSFTASSSYNDGFSGINYDGGLKQSTYTTQISREFSLSSSMTISGNIDLNNKTGDITYKLSVSVNDSYSDPSLGKNGSPYVEQYVLTDVINGTGKMSIYGDDNYIFNLVGTGDRSGTYYSINLVGMDSTSDISEAIGTNYEAWFEIN